MFIQGLTDEYVDYLKDESRLIGYAEGICFPESEAQVQEVVRGAWQKDMPLTFQGARTGITAGAVPKGGWILNLSRMNRIRALRLDEAVGAFRLTVEPGILLCDLQRRLEETAFDTADWDEESLKALARFRESGPHFFSPDPTETTASLGGMAACNASGARSFRYQSMRAHVRGLRVVTQRGEVLSMRRGELVAHHGEFSMHSEQGTVFTGRLPGGVPPKVSKCAAGYFLDPSMDLTDLFIGAEGTLGVITEITVGLLPLPKTIWGVMIFLPEESAAWRFIQEVRALQGKGGADLLAAVEYFDGSALNLLRGIHGGGMDDLPVLKERWNSAVYVEYHGEEEPLEQALEELCGCMERYGLQDEDAWIADHPRERERMRLFRHAVPETVNGLIAERKKTHPGLTKLGTDMAVPDERLEEMMRMYREDLNRSGLESVIFGHIGNNHVHVNIIPRDPGEYEAGKRLYLNWAARVVDWGGTVSAEHGIGKLKAPFLKLMVGESELREWMALKRVFDPKELFNPGNLFGV
ncbi:MAG: FAD-binding oxidoreductase [Kiritimatiellae bacterium]|nr:FAD-binding oxidoreductase [Kiritimatiellia bacterium]